MISFYIDIDSISIFLMHIDTFFWEGVRRLHQTVKRGLWHEKSLTFIQLTWRIWWAPNNASRWQMGFNSVLKELRTPGVDAGFSLLNLKSSPCCQPEISWTISDTGTGFFAVVSVFPGCRSAHKPTERYIITSLWPGVVFYLRTVPAVNGGAVAE
jgi:hypothetical protein